MSLASMKPGSSRTLGGPVASGTARGPAGPGPRLLPGGVLVACGLGLSSGCAVNAPPLLPGAVVPVAPERGRAAVQLEGGLGVGELPAIEVEGPDAPFAGGAGHLDIGLGADSSLRIDAMGGAGFGQWADGDDYLLGTRIGVRRHLVASRLAIGGGVGVSFVPGPFLLLTPDFEVALLHEAAVAELSWATRLGVQVAPLDSGDLFKSSAPSFVLVTQPTLALIADDVNRVTFSLAVGFTAPLKDAPDVLPLFVGGTAGWLGRF